MILVVLYHASGFLQGGFVGVDVFFVVSGFVITKLILKEVSATGKLSFSDFYARRVRRLLPALAFFLIATLVLSALILSPLGTQQTAGSTGRATSVFSANLYLYSSAGGYFDTSSTLNPFLHMWSLAVEEQFYLVFPGLIALAWWVARRKSGALAARFTAVVLALVAVVSFVLSVALTRPGVSVPGLHEPLRFAFYMSPSRAWEFIAGALLVFVGDRFHKLGTPLLRIGSFVGMAMILVASFAYSDGTTFPGITALLPVVGTVLVLIGGVQQASRFPGLSSKLMVWLGDLSYSWYLWHWPFVVFARQLINGSVPTLLAASVLSLIPSVISYKYVEQPFRFGTRWRGWKAVGLAASCICVPVLVATSVTFAANHHWGSDDIAQVASQNALHADVVRGCDGAAVGHAGCRWPAKDQGRTPATAVLLGDSNAGHFTEPVVAAAEKLNLDLVVSTLHGCPFAELTLARGTTDGTECLASVDRVIDQTIALHPKLVLLASAADLYIREPGTFAMPGLSSASDEAGKAKLWEAGLSKAARRFTDAGIAVLIVHPIPHFNKWGLAECSMPTMIRGTTGCGVTAPRDVLIRRGALALTAERSIENAARKVSGVDFSAQLCPQPTCATNDANFWLYRDSAHLSVPGSLTLTDSFAAAMQSALG